MAYNKRTWLGRQGTGLNKFSIGGATPVTIVNQPDSVTQVGDALSAGNLNDLEDRIEDAFDDVDTALDTKADEQDVTNLNNALTAIDHRVQNLEEAKGSYVVANYKDGAITPSGKGAWSIVEGLRGVSRVENQMIPTDAFPTTTRNGVTFTNNGDGTITADSNGSPASGYAYSSYSLNLVVGHAYLMFGAPKKTNCGITVTSPSAYDEGSGVVFNAVNANPNMYVFVQTGETVSNLVYRPQLVDLDIYFNTSDLSFLGATDSAKLATIQTNYPHLLLPSDYGQRIVDSSYSGVRAWSPNLFDQEWEVGGFDGNGNPISSSNIRSKNYIPIQQATSIYILDPSYGSLGHNMVFYDHDKNIIKVVIGTTVNRVMAVGTEFPSNACFMKFAEPSQYGTTYNGDLQVSEVPSGTATSVNTTFHDYFESTLTLSFQGKSAGSVADTCEPNVEVGGVAKRRETTRVNSKNLGNIDWSADGGYGTATTTFSAWLEDCKTYTSAQLADALCSVYKVVTNDMLYTTDVPCLAIVGSGSYQRIRVNDPSKSGKTGAQFKADMSGVLLYYALATESVTLSDPIIDNTLLTESGGRMATVQTGTVVDGSFDLGFITL